MASIDRATPSGQFTNASSVTYTVTFANATLGLTKSNFHLTGTAGIADANIGTPSPSNGGLTWTIAITGLSSVNGTLILNLVNDTGLDNTLTNLSFPGQTYSLDSTKPTVLIMGNPAVILNSTSAIFSFSGSDPTAGGVSSGVNHLETKLDSGAFATATSTQSFTGLSEGSHTFSVQTIDNASNVSSVTSYTWTVDTTAPTVTGVTSSTTNGTYGSGAVISIQVAFSKVVTVTGVPSLALNSGGTASYAGGSGTKTLTFTYSVAAGRKSADLDYTSATAFALSGGTLRDEATNKTQR